MHLGVSVTGAASRLVNANLAQNLARLKRGRQEIDKEFVCFYCPIAVLACSNHFCIKSDDCCRPIPCGIGMRDTATDRPSISDLHVADMTGTLREQGADLLQQIG